MEKASETVKKRVSEPFYIIYILRTWYNVIFLLFFFILFIFNTLHTLLYCNILLFNTLYYFVVLFLCLVAQKYQFFQLSFYFASSFSHIIKKDCIFILFCFNTLQRLNIF